MIVYTQRVDDHVQSCVLCHKALGSALSHIYLVVVSHGNCQLYHLLALGGLSFGVLGFDNP